MADASVLIDKLFCLVSLQRNFADELNKLATKQEKRRKAVNKKQVIGSSMSVLGAAALTVAGVCTGGIAVAPLLLAAKVGSVVGVSTNVLSEVEDAVKSNKAMTRAKEMSEKIENLGDEIKKLMESLAEKGRQAALSRDISSEDYVLEQILRELAKRSGLELNYSVNLLEIMSCCLKIQTIKNSIAGCQRGISHCFMLVNLIMNILPVTEKAGRKVLKQIVKSSATSTASKGAMKVASSAGPRVSAKALKYLTGGAFGLVFSVPELIYNCVKLNNCETVTSKKLREDAKAMLTASDNLMKELDTYRHLFEELANLKCSIENRNRSCEGKKKLLEFAMKYCEDEEVLRWLKENTESAALFKLVDMFHFLEEEFDKEKEKTDRKNIDIVFVAHGAIEASMIQANCLLPLPSIKDVVLYSPWNCLLSADAAYGVATGRILPRHRVFTSSKGLQNQDNKHQPTNLPNCWNSLKKAGRQKIPNIMVSPLRKPEDGAWQRFESLINEHGQPEKNRVVIPFILPEEMGSSLRVPFSVVTLALSLELLFSGFKATVHLTACLGRSKETALCELYLKEQYACTVDNTVMRPSNKMYRNRSSPLYRKFQVLFG